MKAMTEVIDRILSIEDVCTCVAVVLPSDVENSCE